jgi:hypothetical protein
MEHNRQPVTESELIQQVGTWADYNFGSIRIPEYGIVEEIGEAVHCVLKRRQKIRGFDQENIFMEKFSDAMADAIIYLADYCHVHGSFFKFMRNGAQPQEADERRIICHLLQAGAAMLSYEELHYGTKVELAEQQVFNLMSQRICTGIEYWAFLYKLDLPLVVATTWTKVSQRDWKTNPRAPLAHQV